MNDSNQPIVVESPGALSRWWTYQQERFPVFKHGVLIGVFSFSAVCFSARLSGDGALPGLASSLVAFGAVFVFFLLLRVADEFKDYADDSQYRPYRAVPRGLVTLRELACVGVGAAVFQLAITWWLDVRLVVVLLAVWAYWALMCKEFFVGEWLNTQPLLYMASHMVIMPLILLFAFSCDWFARGNSALPSGGLGWLLMASYFSGIVIEVGRKIRAPEDEEEGVDTYSRVWGRNRAAVAWLFAVGLSAVFVCFAAAAIDFLVPVFVVLGAMVAYAGFVVFRYTSKSDRKTAKAIETASGVFVLALYAMVGIVPCFFGG